MSDADTVEGTGAATRRMPAPMSVLVVASAGVFMAFVDATIVNIVFPNIRRSFPEASISGLSWIFNAYNIVFAAFLVAAGRIADLLGRKRVFRWGIEIFMVGSLLCAVAPSVPLLIAARVLQAVGAATVVPASLALVLGAFPAEARSHSVALWTASAALAAGIGPSLGGVLVAVGDWRLAFLVNLPIGALAIVLANRTLVESRAPGRRRIPDIPGALVLAVAIAVLTLGVVQGNQWGWGSPAVLACYPLAAVLLGVFVARSLRHRSPVIDLDLLRIPIVSVANGLTLVCGAGYFAYILCNVLFLTSVWHYSVLDAGLALTPGPFVAAAVAGPFGKIAAARGYRAVMFPGSLVWAAGVMVLITYVGTKPAFLAQWLPAMGLLGVGAGAVFPTLSGAAVSAAPGGRFATATSLNSVARQLGAVVGVAILVAIIGTPSPAQAAAAFDRGWWYAALSFGLAAIGSLWLTRADAASEEERQERPRLRRETPPPLTVTAGAGAAGRLSAFLTEAASATRQSPADFLSEAALFADLPTELLERVAERSDAVRIGAGQWLFRRGDPADCLYVVRSGRLEVMDDDGSVLSMPSRGAALGEMAALTESTRSASVRAARDSELIAVKRDALRELLREAPDFAVALVALLGSKLEESGPAGIRPRARATMLALVPLEADLPTAEIASRLADALGRVGSVALLDGTERELGEGDDPVAVYGPLLDRCERDYDHTLLVTPPPADASPWGGVCMRHADRILAVTGGGPMPEPIAGLTGLAGLAGCDLVLHHRPGGRADWSPWIRALGPRATFRVSSGPDGAVDLDRMARRLAGTSLGLVLSGGGARAFAHIGVLAEFEAAGVEIDRVGGASMGAFIGAMAAVGKSPDEIDALCYDEWVRHYPLNDYRLPRTSLIRGEKAVAMLERTFGDAVIEGLGRDYYCVSADLRNHELVVHRNGLVFKAVAASLSLPVLAPPRIEGQRLLIDGGVLDNLPVEAMAMTGEGPIVAVDVKPSPPPRRPAADNGGAPPERPKLPGMLETLTRVILLASANTSEQAKRWADVVLKPRIPGVGLLEFHQIDTALEAGRVAAREALESAPEVLLR